MFIVLLENVIVFNKGYLNYIGLFVEQMLNTLSVSVFTK